jgi:hypothetical protein
MTKINELHEDTTPRSTRRGLRSAASAALVLALTGGIVGAFAGESSAATTSHAAQVLTQAADAAGHAQAAKPKAGQFEYVDTIHQISIPGSPERNQRWISVDGSQAGQGVNSGALFNNTYSIAAYHSGDSLKDAPYDVLAQLPTDPAQLLKVLSSDPYVLGDEKYNGTSPNVAVWGLMRNLVDVAPAAQKAALFRVAADIQGTVYIGDTTDADGRHGEGVGLQDPRLGFIAFIFDKGDHRFLGERIQGSATDTRVEFNDAVRTVAFVDRVGQLPK